MDEDNESIGGSRSEGPTDFASKQSSDENAKTDANKLQFKCEFCPLIFDAFNALRRHFRKHSRFTCKICNWCFPKFELFKNHMKNQHPIDSDLSFSNSLANENGKWLENDVVEANIKCLWEGCERLYKSRRGMLRHYSRHADVEGNPQKVEMGSHEQDASCVLPSKSVAPLGNRTCPFCAKIFTTPVVLSRHLRCHTGEKPYCCRVCGLMFGRTDFRNTHEKIHAWKGKVYKHYSNVEDLLMKDSSSGSNIVQIVDITVDPGAKCELVDHGEC